MSRQIHEGQFSPEDALRFRQNLGVNTERKPAGRVVLLDIDIESFFGDGERTFAAYLNQEVAVQKMPETGKLGAPLGRDPKAIFADLYEGKQRKFQRERMDPAVALLDGLTRKVGARTGLLNPEKGFKLKDVEPINPHGVSVVYAAGLSPTDSMIQAHETIAEWEKNSVPDKERDIWLGYRLFPQDLGARPAMTMGAKGRSLPALMGACAASGLAASSAYSLIDDGYSDIVFFGAVEFCLDQNPLDIWTSLALTGATSSRYDDPEHASRPFDINRDGFVPASGAGVGIFAREDIALELGLPIRWEVVNAVHAIDGERETGMDTDNVARVAAHTSWNKRTQAYEIPTDIIAHATGTPEGDKNEHTAIGKYAGDHLQGIPITSLKGSTGHPLGAAGMFGIDAAARSQEKGIIPPTTNLEEPSPEFEGTIFVAKKPKVQPVNSTLVLNHGFGGIVTGILLKKYQPLAA